MGKEDTKKFVDSIYNKQLEIHYNEKHSKSKKGKPFKLNLQGKIKCPLLNTRISPIVCSKMMDDKGWPRNIQPNACKDCDCFINLSIKKFQHKNEDQDGSNKR